MDSCVGAQLGATRCCEVTFPRHGLQLHRTQYFGSHVAAGAALPTQEHRPPDDGGRAS